MQLRDHQGVKGKRDAYPFDPRLLKIDPAYNVRDLNSADAIERLVELKESIRANGVRMPLEVRLAGEDVFIVAGHRRHKAVMELISEGAEIETVLVLHEAKGTNDAERALNLIISNSGEPLKPLEVAEVVRRLVGYGWTDAQIMTRLGWKSTASVKRHLDMLEMPAAVQKQVRDGDVSAALAVQLTKKPDAKNDPDFAARLIAANKAENKRLGVGAKRRNKVTPKTIERDAPKPERKQEPKKLTFPAPPGATPPPESEADLTSGMDLTSGLPAPQNTDIPQRPAPMFADTVNAATHFIVTAASMDLLALAQTHLNYSSETSLDAPNWEDEELHRLRALAVIDAIGKFKFPGEWESARDAAGVAHEEVRSGEESQDAGQDTSQDAASEAA